MKDDLFWVHCIKAVAIIMVVVLHVAAPYHYQLNEIQLSAWRIVNIYEAIVRPCVPLFFMASGYLLLRVDEPLLTYFVKRLNKIFVPLFFWTLVYVLWMIYYGGQRFVDFGGVLQMFFFPVSYHLWFLYAVIGCYLFIPFLRKLTTAGNTLLLVLYCCIWFFSVAVLPLLQKYSGIKSQIDVSYATGYIGYFVLGFLLGSRCYSKWHGVASGVLIVLSTVFTALATSTLTIRNGGILVGDFTAVLSPSVIIASSAWFVFAKYMCFDSDLKINPTIRALIVSISTASFGVYLIHVIFLNVVVGIYNSKFGNAYIGLVVLIPLITIVVFVLSYVAAGILGRMGILKRIVGK